jgi:hypothetical protein
MRRSTSVSSRMLKGFAPANPDRAVVSSGAMVSGNSGFASNTRFAWVGPPRSTALHQQDQPSEMCNPSAAALARAQIQSAERSIDAIVGKPASIMANSNSRRSIRITLRAPEL